MKKLLLRSLKDNRGFTFLEIMIVVLIIGILSAIVGVNIIGGAKRAKEDAARIQIKNLESALILFKTTCGFFPSTEQGLEALVSPPTAGKECKGYPEGGFLGEEEIPEDSWNNPYQYEYPGSHGKSYDIWTEGDEDNPKTIGNWKEKDDK